MCGLLMRYRWNREPDMVTKGMKNRPVFSQGYRKVVVGELWTTYYTMNGGLVENIDSVKTVDIEKMEKKLASWSSKRG